MRECLVRFREFFSHLVLLLLLLLQMFLFCSVLHLPLNDSRAKVEERGRKEGEYSSRFSYSLFSLVQCHVMLQLLMLLLLLL